MSNFPVKVGDKSGIDTYIATLTNGEEQLLITRDGKQYLSKGDGTKIEVSDIIVVDTLPQNNIKQNKIYILSTDFSMNYYDGSWHKLNDNQIIIGTTNADTSKLWLDTNNVNSPLLKYHNGTSWINISSSIGGHTIKDETTTYTSRKNLKFTGGVTITDDSANDTTIIDIASSSGGFLNVKGLGMTIADGGSEAIISFTNPASDNIDKVYLYVSYLEDLSNQAYDYVSTHATLLKDSFPTTNGTSNTYNLPITDTNRNKNCYVRVYVGYGGTDYSSGASINQVLSDVTPTSPVTNISITQLTKSSVKLNWTNPTEADLKSINLIQKYDTTINDIYDGTIVYTGSSNTCTITGLDIGKHVYFRFYTLDKSDNIQNSNTQAIDFTMDTTPTSPIDITKVTKSEGYGYIKIKWEETNLESDWKKTIVRISEGSPITSIEQGNELIVNTTRDYYKTNWLTKSGLVNGTKYFINFATVDNFDNVSSITYIDATPVASALNEVSNFKSTNIENGTKVHLSWTNPMSMASATFNGRVIFYSKTEDLEGKTYDYCSTNATVLGIITGVGTGSGVVETFDITSVIIGEHYNFRAFARYDISGTNYYSSGESISNFEVKDETPCLDYTNISFIGYDSMARLKYTDPTDLDWNKTVIIISKNEYISDEDSTSTNIIQKIVSTTRNEYSTNSLQFNSLTNETQYYISLFSYDVSNNVNKNVVNRATVIPNTVVVNNPTTFNATSNSQGIQINLSWTNASGNYTSREIYGSTIDITNLTQTQCQSGGYLLNSGIGTGSGISDSYSHTGVTYNTQYYYKIFTKYTYNSVDYYSTGVISNAKPLDTQAPLDLVSFTANAKDSEIDLTWSFNSSDTDIQKIVIIRNTTATPTNESDGIIVVNSNITSYNDTGLTNGITYYYRAFIYDIHSNINNNDVGNNELNAIPMSVREYGINWNKSADVVTRLGSAVGLNAPVINGDANYTNDFSNLYPWKDMKRVNLSDSGVENAIYGDVTYKIDGTNGQCMVRIPKFYYKVVTVDVNNIQFWIATAPKDGYEVHPAFFRCRDKLCDDQTGVAIEVDKRYYHTYLPSLNGTKLESKSGVFPSASINLTNGRTYAKNRGNGWGLVDFNLRYAVQLLYLIEYASFDSQTKIGRGFVDGNNASHMTGDTNLYGNNSYGETTGKLQMSYRGIEDFYGNCSQWIDGFFCNASKNIMIGNKGFNNIGTGYNTYVTGLGNIVSGYISDIFGDKTSGFVPKVCSGSGTTKLYDYGSLYFGYFPIAGGTWTDASATGVFHFRCIYSASDASANFVCSLAF